MGLDRAFTRHAPASQLLMESIVERCGEIIDEERLSVLALQQTRALVVDVENAKREKLVWSGKNARAHQEKREEQNLKKPTHTYSSRGLFDIIIIVKWSNI